jgi:two-component sensor histidine kinase
MKTASFVFVLLIFPFLLPAQDKHGYFPLKPGDWFEMQVTRGDENGPYLSKEPSFLPGFRLQLRYHLLKQLQNGNQQYKIAVERAIIYNEEAPDEAWMGSDSYYPPYKQQPSKKAPKGAYLLEIGPDGNIISLSKDSLHLPSHMILYEISSRKFMYIYKTSGIEQMTGEQMKDIVKPMLAHRQLPNRINDSTLEYAQLLIAASFPISANTIVQGTTDVSQVSITCGDSIWKFPVNRNGSFSCPLFITKPQQVAISAGNHLSYAFLLPGDTLKLNNQWAFSGSAAINSQLTDTLIKKFGETLDPIRWATIPILSEALLSEEKETYIFNDIVKRYKAKATPVCIDYFETYWQYRIGCEQLSALSRHNYQVNKSLRPFQDIPEKVAAMIDNLPLVLNPYPQEPFYKSYIGGFLAYQQTRASYAVGGNSETFGFYADFSGIMSSLKGFPLYFKLSLSIKNELRDNSWTINRRLKPYYEDFINNCDDSAILTPLIKDWEVMERWAPGKTLPIKLTMTNGNTYNVVANGKTTCLLINYYGQTYSYAFRDLVKSHPEVHFIYAWIHKEGMEDNAENKNQDDLIKNLPNVTVIELKNYEEKNYELYGISRLYHNNFVVLDQWGKIIDDHIIGNETDWRTMNEAIEKASKSTQFSTTQKANVMNIFGWSLGSILITVLIGLWIYRVRIRRIKLKNTIQELEVKAIRSQMNPHFIFNALNSIQSLINTSQYKAANTYLVKFSMLLRSVLNNAEKNTLSLQDELSTIQLYCELEQLRFDFSFKIEIPEETDQIEIPGMIIQPLVENAIIHGLAPKGKDGSMIIKIEKQDTALQISIQDNGAGFQLSSENGKHTSVGLKLVKQRLQLFSGPAQKSSLRYISSTAGTTAILTIPIEAA